MKKLKYLFKKHLSRIELISVALILTSLILGCIAIIITPPNGMSWNNMFISLSVALFQLALGILIVNVYLSKQEKKDQMRVAFDYVNQEIITFHNHLKRLLSAELSYNGYRALNEEYESYDYDTKKMANKVIEQYVNAISKDYRRLRIEMEDCIKLFNYISHIVSVENNYIIAETILSARKSYQQFRVLNIKKKSHHSQIFENVEKFDDCALKLLGLLCISPDIRDKVFGSRIHHNW